MPPHRIRRNRWWVAIGTSSVLIATGCTPKDEKPADVTSFDSEPSVVISDIEPNEDWPAASLYEDNVFHQTPGALTVYSASDGREINQIEPETPLLFEPDSLDEHYQSPPVITEIDGDPVALTAFAVEPSSGEQVGAEVVIVDAQTGEERWRDTLPEVSSVAVVPQSSASVNVDGADDGVALISVSVDWANELTLGLSLEENPEVLWHETRLSATGIHDGVAAGFGPGDGGSLDLVGFDIRTGETEWTGSSDINGIGPAGPWLIATTHIDEPQSESDLISIADGSELNVDSELLTDSMFCTHDDEFEVVVCADIDTKAVAVDTDSGDILWSDDDWDGIVKALWNGVTYVERDDAAVALDSRTGDILEDDPGAAPAFVNDVVGIDQKGTELAFHPVD